MSALIRFPEGMPVFVDEDCRHLADDAPLPAVGKITVSLKRWRAECEALKASTVGVRIENSEDILKLWPELADRGLIALEFPKSGDGRAYSQARLLRERCGYRGELRAIGDVLRDQLLFMRRCGFDVLALRADQNAEDCRRAFADFGFAYQEPAERLPNVWKLRRA